jgi:hypothetical protein
MGIVHVFADMMAVNVLVVVIVIAMIIIIIISQDKISGM